MFFDDLITYVLAWLKSRRWRGIMWLGLLIALPPLVVICIATYGALISRQVLVGRYLALVRGEVEARMALSTTVQAPVAADGPATEVEMTEVEMTDGQPASNNTSESDSAEKSVSSAENENGEERWSLPSLQVPLRRILQLGNFNERVAYVVAREQERQGRLPLAAKMMRDIAPLDKQGLPAAHAWLAMFELGRPQRTPARLPEIMHDLDAADRGGAEMAWELIQAYARLLEQSARTTEALALLRTSVRRKPELLVAYADFAKKYGTETESNEAVRSGLDRFVAKANSGLATVQDVAQAIQLALIDQQLDQALEIAGAAWKREPESPEYSRLYSQVLLEKYKSLIDAPEKSVDLAQPSTLPVGSPNEILRSAVASGRLVQAVPYLEAANKIDPTNPKVVEQVALLSTLGQSQLSEPLRQVLQRSLVDGKASGLTHLILANDLLIGDTPAAAIPHLRLSLRQMPNSSVVLNNLAYALLKYDPQGLSEAASMIQLALSLPGASLVDQAAMLDTLGEVRLAQSDTIGAIESFEAAILRNTHKLNTRHKLVAAYLQAGMTDMARAQQAHIDNLNLDP